jgi:hypothetical protein
VPREAQMGVSVRERELIAVNPISASGCSQFPLVPVLFYMP